MKKTRLAIFSFQPLIFIKEHLSLFVNGLNMSLVFQMLCFDKKTVPSPS